MRQATLSVLFATQLLLLPTLCLAEKSKPDNQKTEGIPVTRVALYKNGVGFFEHTGHINGNAAVTIDFTSGQLNDVLQSLTAIDLNGGRISGAGYNSTTPLDQQLKALPLSLNSNPTAADFYSAIRGARVEVHSGTVSITGRLLSVEDRTTSASSSDDAKPSPNHFFLTVVSESGEIKTLELTPTTTVRLADSALHTDVTRYLQLIDSTRNQSLRHLTLEDHGTGNRELHVSYISEVPVWKSTYRILFTDRATDTRQTATLQGWSVVDNTTGTDWNNVQLSLIAGAPQSFIQPLSQPIYTRRPEIAIAQEAMLTPQTFESSNESNTIDGAEATNLPINGRSVGQLHGAMPAPMMASAKSMSRGAMGNGSAFNYSAETVNVSADTVALQTSNGNLYQQMASKSLDVKTTTAAFDDFFEYKISEPVTIHTNESALVPILQTKINADRVTLVSSNGYSIQQPLRALWITNTSGLILDRGSFTIVENGNFGGEGLLDPIHPNEKRLLSYAADQAVHVTIDGGGPNSNTSSTLERITASKGVIIFHRSQTSTTLYKIHNSAAEARTVVLEHPVNTGAPLISDLKPEETTSTVYRFRVTPRSGETVKLPITTKHHDITSYRLTNSNDDQIAFMLREVNNNPALTTAIAPILTARRHVSDAQTAVNQTTKILEALRVDEERQRANITALQTADKTSRDRFVHDLNQTEDQITNQQKELSTRTTTLDNAKAELANLIENFQFSEDL